MEGVVCLICCQTVNSSTSPSGRGRKRRKFSDDQEENHYAGDEEERARSLLEELYQEVGGGGHHNHQEELATWTLCLTCVTFIDSAVVERRRCRELEVRVTQLQRELLEELRRLKEGMRRFYGELRQVEELAREGEQDYNALLGDGRLPNVTSVRGRIFEAVSELQVFQDDLNARLVVSPSPDMSCEDPVEAAVAMMKVEQVGTDSDSSWGDLVDGSFDIDDDDIAGDVDEDGPEADLSAVEEGITSVTQSMKTDPKPSSPAGLEERLRSQDPEPNIKVRPASRKSKRKANGRRVVNSDSETDTENESDWEVNSDHDGDSSSDDDEEEAHVRKMARTSKSKAGRESGTRSRQSRRIVRSDTSSDDEDQEDPPRDTSLKEQFISKALQVRNSKSNKQGHFMEYDSQAEKLTLGGVEVTFVEEGEGDDSKYVKCGSCPFTVTWSEALSSIKGKFKRDLQIIKKMVSSITAHIHASHLQIDTSTRPSLKQQFISKALQVKKVQSIQPKRPDVEYKRHFMEYDPQAESLTLGGIPLTFTEDDESGYVQCGFCTFQVTWSEASSSIKGKYNGEPQILHKLVSSITTHIHGSHLDAFKCHICGQSLASRKQFLKHMNRVHSTQGAVSCEICGMPLKHRSGLTSHKRTHMNEEERAAAVKNGKNDPSPAPDQDPGYRCGTCGKHFKYQKYLRQHEQTQHSDLKEYVICPICGKTVKKRSYITYHKRFSCPLTEGGRDHLEIQCLHCPKILKNPRLLRVHMNRFHSTDGEKRAYLCSVCGKGFRAQGDVQMHMKTHEKERPWECRWGCGRDFNVERNCRRHETTCRNTKFDGDDSHS